MSLTDSLIPDTRQDGSASNFFQDFSENTCSLQPTLKSNAPGLLFATFVYIKAMFNLLIV